VYTQAQIASSFPSASTFVVNSASPDATAIDLTALQTAAVYVSSSAGWHVSLNTTRPGTSPSPQDVAVFTVYAPNGYQGLCLPSRGCSGIVDCETLSRTFAHWESDCQFFMPDGGTIPVNGEWTIDRLFIYDYVLNNLTLYTKDLANLGFPTTFTVTGGVTDNTPPTCTSISVSNTMLQTNFGTITITVSATCSDDAVKYQIFFQPQNAFVGQWPTFTYTGGSNEMSWAQGFPPNVFDVAGLLVWDAAGNSVLYGVCDPNAFELPSECTRSMTPLNQAGSSSGDGGEGGGGGGQNSASWLDVSSSIAIVLLAIFQ